MLTKQTSTTINQVPEQELDVNVPVPQINNNGLYYIVFVLFFGY